ncbi:MAG: hypothetical protein JSV50_01165 [Desulfobacteraceae bacterium]|nr:MAG: hypothetical protein JSV50_01165 [Desulfobacteraceae bacterium]
MHYFEKAMDLDVHLVSEYPECKRLTENLFHEISRKLNMRNQSRSKQTLKLVIINLWISFKTGMPIKYSRDRNKYLSHKRYGKLHIKYKRLIPIIDTLEDLGFVHQKAGFFDREKGFGRQTRMIPSAKMISLFKDHLLDDPGFLRKSKPNEMVQLKNNHKDLIDYVDTRSVRDMRTNLHRYNEFIEHQRIEVCAPSEAEVNARFLIRLKINLLKGVVDFNCVDFFDPHYCESEITQSILTDDEIYEMLFPTLSPTISGSHGASKDMIIISDASNSNNTHPLTVSIDNSTVYQYLVHTSHHTITQHNLHYLQYISTMTQTLRDLKDEKTKKAELLRKRPIADFGLDGLYFQSHYQYLHRVFNNESFKLGGRFYGAFHLELPKELRSHIEINNEPTVELDFSALHIRMLYHLEGIDYRQDPYTAVCDSEEERKIYKLVQLIAINSESEKKAVKAIRDQLRKNDIIFDLSNKSILRCLGKFRKFHYPIAKYLNTGVGLKLQNLDSRIADIILKAMTSNEIPCLPVHDSYIVRETDMNFLLEVMKKSYERIMNGFSPIIKCAMTFT